MTSTTAETVMRIFWAHTAPLSGGSEHLPVEELWGGVNPPAGNQARWGRHRVT